MKTSIKWILGIVIGLAVVAVLVGAGYLLMNRWSGGYGMMDYPAMHAWGDQRGIPYDGMPMHPDRGFLPMRTGVFAPLWIVAGGLFCLGALALIVLGIIALVRVISRPAASSPAIAPAPVTVEIPASGRPCPNCERPVQEEWSHCPYCGQVLTTS
jgi:hypothetical protein